VKERWRSKGHIYYVVENVQKYIKGDIPRRGILWNRAWQHINSIVTVKSASAVSVKVIDGIVTVRSNWAIFTFTEA
jgi:hypothetical protein